MSMGRVLLGAAAVALMAGLALHPAGRALWTAEARAADEPGDALPPLSAGWTEPAAPAAAAPEPSTTASGGLPDEVDDLNERAHRAIAEGRAGDAVTLLESALAKAPGEQVLAHNLAYAYFLRAKASLEQLDFERALADQRKAVEHNDDEPLYKLHLGNTFLRVYRLDEARAALTAAVEQAPDEVDARLLLGDALALADELAEAVVHYDRAVELAEGDKRALATRAAERTRRQLAVERDYVTEASTSFLLRHPPGTNFLELLSVLERARGEVVADLGLRPSNRALVVLYPPDDFREVTGTHDWVGGLFDRKIRLPIGDIHSEGPRIEAAFRHEFAHLLVSEIAPRCPAFLNEGLAQFVEFGRGEGLSRLVEFVEGHGMARESVPDLSELPDSFLSLSDKTQVSLGYRLSFAFVDHVVAHHGLGAAVRWVRESARQPVAEAYRAATGRSLEDEEALFRELFRTAR